MRISLYILLLFAMHFGATSNLYSQTDPDNTAEIDSLELVLRRAGTDSDRVKTMLAISALTSCSDTAAKLLYAKNGKLVAERINWVKGTIQAKIQLGEIYQRCGKNSNAAVDYYKQALSVAPTDKLLHVQLLGRIADTYKDAAKYSLSLQYYRNILALNAGVDQNISVLGNMGIIYHELGDYSNELACYDSALKSEEKMIKSAKKAGLDDTLQMGVLLFTIGGIYLNMNEISKAKTTYDRVLGISNQTKNKYLSVLALTGIGETYRSQHNLGKALESFEPALAVCVETKNTSDEANLLDLIANVYLEKGDPARAIAFAHQALQLSEDHDFLSWLPKIHITLGDIYIYQGDYAKAIEHLKKAIDMCKETGAIDFEKAALGSLSKAYEQTHQPALALEAYKNFILLRDSIYNIDKANEMTRMDLKSDYDRQKLVADAAHDLQIQKQRVWTYGGFAGLGLVVVLSFFIYRNYANQKKANILITVEKENAEVQRQRAERSEQFKQQFLANMSHEIRTPMNAVSGMTDLLIEKAPRPDQLNYLQVISKSSDILLHIINDILDLSKIEAGKLEMEQIDFSLADTVNLVRQTLSVKAEEKGLHLITEIDDTATDVLVGDPYRINQVLINLGGNAIKFTERGTVEIAIKKTAEDHDTISLEFAVHDTGAGIPEDKLNDLFESFKQVNRSDTRKYGGTGLGLSISKQLVELQGGTISVVSKVGLGTTFSFTILFPKGSAERLADRTRGEQQADGSVLYGLRILLADDNEYNRLVASEALNLKAKVVIHEAHNGEEALQMLAKEDYDVVLMDVQMPVMNGLDATRAIRSQLPAPKNQTPVIALTASMLRNDLDKCIQAGMNTYVPKPFKTSQLIAAIAQVTGRLGFIAPPEAYMAAKETVSPTLSIPSEGGVTDLAALIKFCEGEEDRVKKYISIYLRAVPGFEEKAKAAIAARNMEKIATLAHTFKPKWMMMGMEASATLARKIEALSFENGDVDIACQYLSTLIEHNTLSVPELERNV